VPNSFCLPPQWSPDRYDPGKVSTTYVNPGLLQRGSRPGVGKVARPRLSHRLNSHLSLLPPPYRRFSPQMEVGRTAPPPATPSPGPVPHAHWHRRSAFCHLVYLFFFYRNRPNRMSFSKPVEQFFLSQSFFQAILIRPRPPSLKVLGSRNAFAS